MTDERVFVGGLMRCCTGTLARVLESQTEPTKEGTVLPCDHCDESMIFTDGAWRWKS
jgi:hypothetical protein